MLKGNLNKYFIYALGEVILIVVGILIAMQLNTLNESRNLEKKRSNLIERLVKQMEINAYQTKESIAVLEDQLEDIRAVLGYMGQSKSQINPLVIDSLMASVIEDHNLGLDLITLQEALDTGEVSILKYENL
ncbi:MAG: hypothetical protein AAF705_05185, partial [Bacteroidota bacterium]